MQLLETKTTKNIHQKNYRPINRLPENSDYLSTAAKKDYTNWFTKTIFIFLRKAFILILSRKSSYKDSKSLNKIKKRTTL